MRKLLFLFALASLVGCYNAAPTTTVVPSNPTVVVPGNPTVVQPVETVIIRDHHHHHHVPAPTPAPTPGHGHHHHHHHHHHSGIGVHVDGVKIDIKKPQCSSDKPCGHCNKCRPSVSIGVDISK